MAKFPGPRFLLLVLAGLALCVSDNKTLTQPSTVSPTSTSKPVTPANSPISKQDTENPNTTEADKKTTSPPITSTQQHPSTTQTMITDGNEPGLPPNTNVHQHQTNTTLNKKDSNKPGLPPNTNVDQHQANTTLNDTDSNETGLPPNTTVHQHSYSTIPATTAETLTTSTSDSPHTISTMITTPPLTPPTTVGIPKCNYTLKEENDSVKVKIDRDDSSEVVYTFEFKDELDGSFEVKGSKSFPISLKSFRPCRNYSVTVDPPCNSTTNELFKTRDLKDEDVLSLKLITTEKKVKVCLQTIWNLSDCFDVDHSNSCKTFNVTEGNPCKNPLQRTFTLPPAKPVIKFENRIPTRLSWVNGAHCTGDLTYTCRNSSSRDVQVTDLEPFTNYTCTGTYNLDTNITSSRQIYITCDVNEPNMYSVSHSSIDISWDFTSDNCPTITEQFTWKATCNDTKTYHNQNTMDDLKPYTYYTCKFMAKYGNVSFYNISKTERTNSAKPTGKGEPKVTSAGHNDFRVKCELDQWNGEQGTFFAKLKLDGYEDIDEKPKKECDFTFENLYYLTTYNFEIYATNRNGDSSRIHFGSHRTRYNDKAVLGFLGFLIVITTLALLFVLYKIYLLKREKSSRNEQEMDDLLPTNALLQVEPMSAEGLLEAYKIKRADEGRLFMEEFQSVPRIFSNYTIREAKKPENQSKNRYVDILPYDYNRVPLSHGGTEDYINASFIEGYKESNKYIAAQGPKEETIGDFWTMIWEQKTSIIVMVTRCEEGNKNKCAQYWPSMERETEIFDDLVVKIKGEESCPDYKIRHLTLMNRKEKATEREVTHIQFTSWPDHGVPSDPGLLLKLRRRVNSFKNFFSGPIVIHCSAGVGRTGTYIGIDAMIESLEAEGRVDIYGYVVKLRRQRCLMVQVEAQYVLIHTALIEYSQFGETELSLSHFHSEVNTLRQKEGNEPSLMEMEFQKLPKFKNYRASNTARSEENKKKNRSSIVPYDFNRVQIKVDDEASHDSEAEDEEEYSSDEEDEIPTKYINASYVDGYWAPSSIIVAQGPMSDTVGDFLHMLYQKKVKVVFMLSDCTENDKEFCSKYWDDEKKTFGEMEVEVKETENTPTYVRRCLEIQHTKRKDSHTLQQYHFLKWAGRELPENPLDLVDMMKSVRQTSNSSKNKILPIVAHCNDGSSRSGVFCALWKLLDSADTEKLVDIFQVSKDLRKARLGMINSQEQYEFLYTALEAAYPVQNGEVKKASEAPADSVQVINESTALLSPSTDAATKESTVEGTDSASPVEGAPEASSEPKKDLSESTVNGPTANATANATATDTATATATDTATATATATVEV